MESNQNKFLAVIQVILVVFVASLLFRLLGITPLHGWEMDLPGGQKLLLVEYVSVLIFVLLLLALTRRRFIDYGINFSQPKLLLTVIATAFFPFLMLGAILSFVNWRQWSGAILVSLASVGVLFLVAWLLRKKPMPGSIMALGFFVFLAPYALNSSENPVGLILLKTAYFYLLVAPAEELLFRGYVQSRMNEVWGRPYTFFGVKWGWGILFGAILFGLWHVMLMPAVPGVWFQALWTSFAGLALGFLREKTGSVVPSSILHSVINYIPFI
jgi:hypothetical protein